DWHLSPHRRGVLRLPGDRRHLMGRLAGFRYRDITRRLKALVSISVFSVVYFSKNVANWSAAQQI
ncbi:MAG: hypothetical protein ABSH33_22410, partial [Steroidobacteraceae bacterium]